MDEAERAFWMGVWRAILAGLIFFIVIGCYVRSVEGALLAGANIALVYAVVMMIDATRWARMEARFSILRFAQRAAALAIALCISARLI